MARSERKISCTTIGARPIDGSSSSSRRGLAIKARPMASICCSPPDRLPALPVGIHVLQAAAVGAQLQVFQHCHGGKDGPAFRHLHDAARHELVRGQVGDVFAFEPDAAARFGQQARQRQQRGRFAGAVLAQQGQDFALPKRQRDIVIGRQAAEALGDPRQLQGERRLVHRAEDLGSLSTTCTVKLPCPAAPATNRCASSASIGRSRPP
ncbi:hypothetical protein G6F68_013164 [Rhizopus microsporus]|nr:hypothetical protein G6F68_013164 [Rhizopus microsporus]